MFGDEGDTRLVIWPVFTSFTTRISLCPIRLQTGALSIKLTQFYKWRWWLKMWDYDYVSDQCCCSISRVSKTKGVAKVCCQTLFWDGITFLQPYQLCRKSLCYSLLPKAFNVLRKWSINSSSDERSGQGRMLGLCTHARQTCLKTSHVASFN